jgi:hypothetical protein
MASVPTSHSMRGAPGYLLRNSVGPPCMTADLRSFFTFREARLRRLHATSRYVRNTALRARNKHDPRHACVNLKHVCLGLPTTITTVLERKGF